ncbi:hypothetical protein SAMN05216302_100744 [Nitrosomonas aestuarii]|uniref:SMODS and SLOG-associating 2TM effector domain-containing protein n=1 Tax=Nitrosomonas aestuarii TaxID=52441 RepID=A0A1I3ZSE6_9PROT|nr:hypothetical protein [Nitrosomonas aestuarii]SFK47084.1 hypothetical protein SAMN05216302_100744 [Nitrosomonas aestuarii]
MSQSIQEIAANRQAECKQKALYFDSRLRFFSKTNLITVIVPSLLGVIAGSALFTSENSSWLDIKIFSWLGIGTLAAALLTAIHKGLDCDAHQAECRRLVQAYRGLETRYRTIAETSMEDASDKLAELEEKLAILKESQLATVNPQWIKDNARDA